jgi:hypothetical protein
MKKIFYIILGISFTAGFSGCSKYLDKLDNPNLVTVPPLNGLLAKATYATGNDVFLMGNVVSYYNQYLASNVRGSDADIYNPVDYSGTWTEFYTTMMNIKQMNDLALKQGAYLHSGIGKILLAYNLNMLINTFGDVPFTEALQGQQLLVPKFDSQATLQASALQMIDDGIADLNKTGSSLNLDPASDVIHHGAVKAWVKTGNALKARFLNQLSKTKNYNPASVLSALTNAYTSNADDATLTAFNGRSPWNAAAYNNTQLNLDGWLGKYFVDALNGTTYGVFDPRLPKIATITKFGDYRGTANGAGRIGTGTNQEESYLSVNGSYSGGNAPLLMVTYAEMKFIEAEASLASGNKAKAYAAYLEGIRANMDRVGVSEADKNTYISKPQVSAGEANISADLIFKEKYIAMFLNPEGWVDARRFNYKYKNFQLPQGSVLTTFIRRLSYPTVETSRNGANVPVVKTLDERLAFDEN